MPSPVHMQQRSSRRHQSAVDWLWTDGTLMLERFRVWVRFHATVLPHRDRSGSTPMIPISEESDSYAFDKRCSKLRHRNTAVAVETNVFG
jgi:hypothetical protein